ncbi:MAG: RdgB/HAM1 family non-canonical purine NTP pyrophosphatase [Bacilli bacterium]|nr:RdgB/HAM1 family non-canonical purine NTP pyrophosphatase [Bacilli bacterium]
MNYEIVLASNNAHKLKEVREILCPHGIIVYGLNDVNLHPGEVIENAPDYYGNALIKAKSVQELTSFPIIADDSGLEIEALDNGPGIKSARFAKEHGGHAQAIEYILKNIKDNRKARFICDICLLNVDNKPLRFEGIVEGEIAYEPYGEGGFGYDPIFICKESGKTYAEMDQKDKNKLSHRGKALKKLLTYLLINGKIKH